MKIQPTKSVTVGRLTLCSTKSSDGLWQDANGQIMPFFRILRWENAQWRGRKFVLGGRQFGLIWQPVANSSTCSSGENK